MSFIRRIGLPGLLSFPPKMEPFELQPLNVLIGPNGAGKTNFIEALELLRATPTDFAAAIRDGGGAAEWLWKGESPQRPTRIDVETGSTAPSTHRPLRYRLEFTSTNNRVEVLDEAIEEVEPVSPAHRDVYFYYRFNRGWPAINVNDQNAPRYLQREDLAPDQSVLAQRQEPDLYPEVTWIARTFKQIQTFRDWTFGRYAQLRQPQPTDLPEDRLLPDNRNLALLLNQMEHRDPGRFNELLKRFFPRFERMSTKVSGGTVQFYLHEPGFSSPIPPTRLSDGTVRFVAILATLLTPSPPPLVCIEEPELGMHPDAVAMIGDLLVEASERMQIVVTTHSDTLVSSLTDRVDAVVVCERPGSSTELRRIEAGKIAHWLDEYRLGELWRIGGLGGNP